MNKLFSFLLALLGFGGCGIENPEEYGCPTADFKIMGRVTDVAHTPVADVDVTFQYSHMCDNSTYRTNDLGSYLIEGQVTFVSELQDAKLIFDKKGYKPDTVDVVFSSDEFVGGGDWYEGLATKTVNVKLEKQDGE